MPDIELPIPGSEGPAWATKLNAAITEVNEGVDQNATAISNLSGRVDNRSIWSVKDFGAVGNGLADDTLALNAALASGRALYWGGPTDVYRITSGLSRTLTNPMVWRSDGATIILDSPASIQRAVAIVAAGFDITIEGPLTIDAQTKAFTALRFENTGAFCNFSAKGLRVRNVHRADLSMTGGDGIHIRGAFTTVNLVEPDIRNVTMAAGAGEFSVQGISGISVVAAGAGLAPVEVNIVSPFIDGVYSLDPAYMADQDGIKIFTEEDSGVVSLFETHFSIRGGKIKNCGGRSIKSQCEFGSVEGMMFMRRQTTNPSISRVGSYPEVDFQVGGGLVSNCEFQYVNGTPDRVIAWSGSKQVGGKYSHGITVQGIKVSYSGGAVLDRFFTANMYEQTRAVINIQNVEVVNLGASLGTAFATVNGATTNECVIRIQNCAAPLSTGLPFFRRIGPQMPTFSSLENLANYRGSQVAAFSVLDGAGENYTQVVSGNNVRVA